MRQGKIKVKIKTKFPRINLKRDVYNVFKLEDNHLPLRPLLQERGT